MGKVINGQTETTFTEDELAGFDMTPVSDEDLALRLGPEKASFEYRGVQIEIPVNRERVTRKVTSPLTEVQQKMNMALLQAGFQEGEELPEGEDPRAIKAAGAMAALRDPMYEAKARVAAASICRDKNNEPVWNYPRVRPTADFLLAGSPLANQAVHAILELLGFISTAEVEPTEAEPEATSAETIPTETNPDMEEPRAENSPATTQH